MAAVVLVLVLAYNVYQMPVACVLVSAFSATFTSGQVMSCTNWSVGHEVWNNGDDIAEWPAFIIDSANAAGTVQVPCLTPTGEIPSYVPATAIEIVVTTN